MNIDNEEIIDVVVIYEMQAILTLTKSYLKIWDLLTLMDIKESQVIFKIKPGYMGIEKMNKTQK